MVPSSVSGSQSSTPSPLRGPHHLSMHYITSQTAPYQTMTHQTIPLSWASHHSKHYIISPPLGSPHPLGQTILCFLGFPRWTHTTIIIVVCIITVSIIIVCIITVSIIIVVCIITVEEYLRCASGWSSFPEDARANHLPLNYVHSISPTPHTAHTISPTAHPTLHTPYHPHCTLHTAQCISPTLIHSTPYHPQCAVVHSKIEDITTPQGTGPQFEQVDSNPLSIGYLGWRQVA